MADMGLVIMDIWIATDPKTAEQMPFRVKPHVHLSIFSKSFDTCSFPDISQDTF